MKNEALQVCLAKHLKGIFPDGEVWTKHTSENILTIYYMSIMVGTIDFNTRTLIFYDMDSHRDLYKQELEKIHDTIVELIECKEKLENVLNENFFVRYFRKMIFHKSFFVFNEVKKEINEFKDLLAKTNKFLPERQEQYSKLEKQYEKFIRSMNKATTRIYQELKDFGMNYCLDSLQIRQPYSVAVEVWEKKILNKAS